jgi:hypothetical protein
MYPSLYLTLYPRAEPLEQSSIPRSAAEHYRHDRSYLRMSPTSFAVWGSGFRLVLEIFLRDPERRSRYPTDGQSSTSGRDGPIANESNAGHRQILDSEIRRRTGKPSQAVEKRRVKIVADIPLHVQRRFEQRWASRFILRVASNVPNNVGTKAMPSTGRRARQRPKKNPPR